MYQDVQFQCPTEAKQKLLWLQDRNHWPNENQTTTMNAKKASEVRSALCHSMCRRENEQPCTDKKLPLFKRDSRPPTTWLGNATALRLMMWRAKDVVCFQRNYWMPHRKLEFEIGNGTPNCLRHHVWLDVSTFNKCLFTTKQGGFLLILICETSQIFVWRNKAFIFFQKSDIKSHCSFFFSLWYGRSRSKARSLHEKKLLVRKLLHGRRWSHAAWQIITTKTQGKTQIPQPDLRLTIRKTAEQTANGARAQQEQPQKICQGHSGKNPLCRNTLKTLQQTN